MRHDRVTMFRISLLAVLFLPLKVQAVVVERIAAVINDDVITLSEVDETVDRLHGAELAAIDDPRERSLKRDAFRKAVLDQMIDQRILSQQYEKLGITATDDDIDAMIQSICKQNGITLDVLKTEIARQGLTYQEYREQLRQHILQSKLVDMQIRAHITVKEEDIKQLYTRQLSELATKEVVELAGVLVLLPRGGGPEAIQIAHKRAEQVRDALLAGQSPDDIERQFSDGSVKSLGNMGKFTRGELMDQLEQAVFKLEPGQVTEPVETSQGLYVIQVVFRGKQKPESVVPYEQVRDQLYQRYYNEQVETQLSVFIKNARKDSHVEILL